MRLLKQTIFLASVVFACSGIIHAQEGHLKLRVTDSMKPLKGIRLIPVDGRRMPSRPTNIDGETELYVPEYKEGKPLTLTLFQAPRALILLPPSPPVPPSRCKVILPVPAETVEVVVVTRGQKILLHSAKALKTFAATILENSFAKSFGNSGTTAEPRLPSLLELARWLELDPKDIDTAIRARASETNDSYEKGLIALYIQNYKEATRQLSNTLRAFQNSPRGADGLAARIINTGFSGELKKDPIIKGPEASNAAYFLGQSLYEQGKYREAVDVLRQLYSLRQYDTQYLNTYAISLYRTREYAQALQVLKEGLALSKGDPASQTVFLNNLALTYNRLNECEKALDSLNNSLAINRKVRNLKSQQKTLQAIGLLYFDMGDLLHARLNLDRSLVISRRLRDKPAEVKLLILLAHLHTSSLFDSLSRRDIDEAYSGAMRSVLVLNEAHALSVKMGDKAAQGEVLNAIADLFLTLGGDEKAEKYYKEAVKVRAEIFGESHPDVVISLEGLAVSYVEQKRYDQAEHLLKSTLEKREKIFGADQPELTRTQRVLAITYSRHGKYTEAESLYKQALAIREKAFGVNSSELTDILDAMAINYARQNNYLAATAQLERSLTITEKRRGADSTELAHELEEYAMILRKLNRDDEAAKAEARARTIWASDKGQTKIHICHS